jgi:hypothetical protein
VTLAAFLWVLGRISRVTRLPAKTVGRPPTLGEAD